MKRTRATIAAATLFCGVLIGAGETPSPVTPSARKTRERRGRGTSKSSSTSTGSTATDGTKTTSPGNSFTMGIAPKIDLAVVYAYDFTKAEDGTKSRGMGPVEATLKTAVIEGKDRFPTLGVKAGFSLPTAEGEQAALLATAIAQWSFEPITVFANVGADVGTHLAGNAERTTSIRASVAGSYEIRKEWYLLSELLWEKQTSPSAPSASEVADRSEEGDHRNVERQRRGPVGAERRFAARDVPARIHARVPWRTFRPGRGSAGRR